MTEKLKNESMTAEQKLAAEVNAEFEKLREERKGLERSWELDMNFESGNQYCAINGKGEIYEESGEYYWQARRVFNHIASTVDLRCSKLGRIRPALTVRAASDEESDRHSAYLSSCILSSVAENCDLDGVISDATVWSEICGTAFYKVIWDADKGCAVGVSENGGKLRQGDVKVCALSPFEIYPYSLSEESVEAQPGIIHAKAMSVQDIYDLYGVRIAGRDLDEFALSPYSAATHSRGDVSVKRAVKRSCEIVIERYLRPTSETPQGRLTVVAGEKVLYDGELPYLNGDGGERTYPFVKQTSLPLAGSFFGASVVDRLIPLQRAYNAVKNRKHEFLNRISMGCVAVEDGSVDTDELAEEGLNPGKIIVYRQGGKPPEMLSLGGVPAGFEKEEENLLTEFCKVSGVGEITDNANGFSGITSATGLQLIIEQDESRMEFTCQQIKRALKDIGRHILRLYRQFATELRLLKYAGGDNRLSILYFKGSDISSDDVVLEADNEANLSPAQRRNIIYEMMDRGLFSDENGKLAPSVKNKILELLGYRGFSGERDLTKLNADRADGENLKLKAGYAEVKPYDDHTTHITEHKAFLLTESPDKETEERILRHIEEHEKLLKEKREYVVNSDG